MFTDLTVAGDVKLNLIDAGHADELFALVERNRGQLRQWLPWLDFNRSVADSLSFIQNAISLAKTKKGAVYEIRRHGTLIGVIGYNSIDSLHGVCEIGYWLDESHQRQGIVTRCTTELVRFAFEHLGMNKVAISVAVDNTASRAVPEKLGFTVEGRSREAEWLYDHHVDHVLYGLLRKEWTGVQ